MVHPSWEIFTISRRSFMKGNGSVTSKENCWNCTACCSLICKAKCLPMVSFGTARNVRLQGYDSTLICERLNGYFGPRKGDATHYYEVIPRSSSPLHPTEPSCGTEQKGDRHIFESENVAPPIFLGPSVPPIVVCRFRSCPVRSRQPRHPGVPPFRSHLEHDRFTR